MPEFHERPLSAFASAEENSLVDGPFGSDLKVSDYTESGIRILQLQNLGDGKFKDANKKYTSPQKAAQLSRCNVKSGDLIIAKMADPLARACIVPDHIERAVIVADLIKLRVDKSNDPRFVCAAINAHNFRREAERLSTGTTRTRISLSTLKSVPIHDPGSDHQRRIAEILSTIDEAIEHTEALIAKTQQIKAGLMHDLFTRGILPNGQLRPPRSEAPDLYKESPLGWIPKEWEVGDLNAYILPSRPIVYGILMPGQGYPGGIPVVKVKDIRDGNIDDENLLLTSPQIDSEYQRSKLQAMDVLLTIRGSVGRMAVVPETLNGANITQDTARIGITRGNPMFFFHYFHTDIPQRHFSINTLGVAVQGINLSEVRKTPCMAPSWEEQDLIADRMNSVVSKVSTLTAELRAKQMVKAGLMHDLLTGAKA